MVQKGLCWERFKEQADSIWTVFLYKQGLSEGRIDLQNIPLKLITTHHFWIIWRSSEQSIARLTINGYGDLSPIDVLQISEYLWEC